MNVVKLARSRLPWSRPGLGWRPNREQPDRRDYDVDRMGFAAPDLPSEPGAVIFDLREHCWPARQQSIASSCVGEGHAAQYEIRERLLHATGQVPDGFEPERLSSYDPYWSGRALEGRDRVRDEGSYPRLVSKACQKTGLCPLRLWPSNYIDINRRPSFAAEMAGLKRLGAEYVYIFDRGDTRIQAICAAGIAGYPIGFGTEVTREVLNKDGPEVEFVPESIDRSVGGHYWVIVAAVRLPDRSIGFWVLNSHGVHYRVGGLVMLHESYIRWGYSSDFTVIHNWDLPEKPLKGQA